MARIGLDWAVRDLAKHAMVAVNTVTRLERGDELKPRTVLAIRRAFEDAGIEFLDNSDGPGVRLRKQPDE